MSKLSKEGLIYFSNKLNKNIVDRLNSVKKMISDLADKVNNDKDELNHKIDNNKNEIDSHSTQISSNTSNIVDLNVKYSELKTEVDNSACDGHPNGDIVNINAIDQFIFTDVEKGDILEIPNDSINDDFIIECYEEINGGAEIEHNVFKFNDSTASDFIYDDRYVEVTATGVKPKSSITLNYTKIDENNIGDDIREIYVSDTIPAELLENIKEIRTIEES